MHLQRIIRAQTDIQADLEELGERVPLVLEEERVITERTHRHADLLEVEEVL